MGNDSNELGHNLMDHHFVIGAGGYLDEFSDKTVYGRKPWLDSLFQDLEI